MPNEVIIDFCKTKEDATNTFLERNDEYTLSRKISDISNVDINLIMNDESAVYVETTPDIYSNVTFYEIQFWRLKDVAT